MPRGARTITREDILTLDVYDVIRADKKQEAILRKKLTQIAIGPNATLTFESWDSMWLQIQEMLRIERGGDAQVIDEIHAYDPMVPKGAELTATLFFEVPDPTRRDALLRSLGGVENHVSLQVGGHVLKARPEGDVQRTRESDGKASAVHFFHFDFPADALAAWKSGEGQAMAVIDHPGYGHAAIIGAETRAFLTRECF